MIVVLCKNLVKKENQEAFIKASFSHANTSLTMDNGCLRFDVLAPEGDDITFLEMWESREDLAKHTERCKSSKDIPVLNSLRYDKAMNVRDIL